MAGLDFNSICRLCVRFFEKEKVSPIFNNEIYSDRISLPERIKHCSAVEVAEDDGLPPQICNNCLSKLNQSFVFRNQCVLADITLKRLKDVSFNMNDIRNLVRVDIENQIIRSEKADFLQSKSFDKSADKGKGTDKIDEFDNRKKGRHIRNIHKFKSTALQKTKVVNKNAGLQNASEEKVRNWGETSVIKNLERVRKEIRNYSVIQNLAKEKQEVKGNSVIKNLASVKEEIKNNSVIKNLERVREEIKNNSEKKLLRNLTKCKKLGKLKKMKEANVGENESERETVIEFIANMKGVNDGGESSCSESETGEASRESDVDVPEPKLMKPKRRKIKTGNGKDKPSLYKCEYCEKVYPSEGGWRYHVHIMHNENYQPFICDLCGKAFKVKKNMEAHKNSIHFKLKSHLCDLCGRGFASKYALKVHNTWHNDEKNYSCDVCGTKFRTRGKLNTHRAIHGGPKNFMCHICSRDFRWKKDFEIHMRTHTGEKPFKCSYCGKGFASLTNMKKHEKNHIKKLESSENNGAVPASDTADSGRNQVLIFYNGLDEVSNSQVNQIAVS